MRHLPVCLALAAASFLLSPRAWGQSTLSHDQSLAARRSPVVQVFEASRDAVVNISCTEVVQVRSPFGGDIFQDFFDSPFGGPRGGGGGRQFTRTGVGSGFVIHPDGYIVTNAHVVAQTAERKVTFADGKAYDAQVVAADPSRDLAILKIDTDKPLPVLHMGRSNDLMIGETVIAIGSPLGYPNTVTAGVISAVERDLDFSNRVKLKGLVQTDASINPGNSGGPLLNVLGELIGVNTAIRGDAQNIGFAIPVDQLREVLPDLLDIERRYRIVSGLTLDTLDAPRVTSVQPGSPAAAAGIQPGDILRSVDDKPITQGIDFSIALIGRKPGDDIRLQLVREGGSSGTGTPAAAKPIQAKLTLAQKPMPDGRTLAQRRLGVEVEDLPPDAAASIGLPGSVGVFISSVEPDGPADNAGLVRRDILLAIGRHSVAGVEDLGQLLEQVDSGDAVPLTVLRIDRRIKMKLAGELTAR